MKDDNLIMIIGLLFIFFSGFMIVGYMNETIKKVNCYDKNNNMIIGLECTETHQTTGDTYLDIIILVSMLFGMTLFVFSLTYKILE